MRPKYRCKKCKKGIQLATWNNSRLCRDCWIGNNTKRCRKCKAPIHKSNETGKCRKCYLQHYNKKWNAKQERKTESHTHCFECNKRLKRRFVKFCSRRCTERYKKIKRRAMKSNVVCEPVCRWNVYQRDKFKCYICGVKVIVGGKNTNYRQATIDHVVPLRLGGHHAEYNLRCCCRRCNAKKRHRPLTEHLLITSLENEAKSAKSGKK